MNPVLISRLFGVSAHHYSDIPWWKKIRRPVLVAAGSILERNKRSQRILQTQTHVWGTGTRGEAPLDHLRRAQIHAVRGPLTRKRLLAVNIACPEIYGDPATLLPRVMPAAKGGVAGGKLVVIPHYVDREQCARLLAEHPTVGAQVEVVDVADDLEKIVQRITGARAVVSSSLHGLIVADAYGVPNARIRFGGEISGGNFKFDDYALSVDRSVSPGLPIARAEDLMAAESGCSLGNVTMLEGLERAFPAEVIQL